MNESSILFVGLDLRRDGIDPATADAPRDGEIRQVGTTAGDLASLDKAVHRRVHGPPCRDHAPPHGCGFAPPPHWRRRPGR